METFDELYYQEPYVREFDAEVVSCEPAGDAFEVELSETAFYPEGGGQPGDRGTLLPEGAQVPRAAGGVAAPEPAQAEQAERAGDAEAAPADAAAPAEGDDAGQEPPAPDPHVRVLDTRKRGDRTVHLTDRPLEPGTRVHGQIDWAFRRDTMEAHTGEHIVSGIVHGLFGYDNVGFHMGGHAIEIDFSGALDDDQVLDVERRANAAVREDLPVEALVPSPEALAAMDYRSKKALEGPVRIVRIPGVDACACCGVHLPTTGQVGLIKVLRATTKAGRTRLELLCGRRALEAVEAQQAHLRAVTSFLTVGDDEAEEAVRRLAAERDDLRHQLRQAHHDAIDAQVAALPDGDGLLVRRVRGLDVEERRHLCEQALAQGKAGVVAVLSKAAAGGKGAKGGKAAPDAAPRLEYVIAARTLDLRQPTKELNARLSGRGGGKAQMVQGSFAAPAAEVEATLAELLG